MAFFASAFIYKERLSICKTCEYYIKSAHMCKECGCFMPAKAKIAKLRCPKDKWVEVYGTEEREPETLLSEEQSTMTEEQKKEKIENTIGSLKKEITKLEAQLNGNK